MAITGPKDINDFVARNTGFGMDFDGYYGDQCVDLIQYWAVNRLGAHQFWGNAIDLQGQTQNGFFRWILNTPDGVPRPGDILVWGPGKTSDGWTLGAAGHTAVFVSGDTNSFTSFDQNWPEGHMPQLVHHLYDCLIGWLQPVCLDPAPAPAPSDLPASNPVPETPVPTEPSQPVVEPAQPVSDPAPTQTESSGVPTSEPVIEPAPPVASPEPSQTPIDVPSTTTTNTTPDIMNMQEEIMNTFTKYNKSIVAAVGLILTALNLAYGSNPYVQLAIGLGTYLGVYHVPNK